MYHLKKLKLSIINSDLCLLKKILMPPCQILVKVFHSVNGIEKLLTDLNPNKATGTHYSFESNVPSRQVWYTDWQVGVCGPNFRKVGLANWHLPLKGGGACERKISKFGGLWAENFQIWRLVSWKFPNLEACELKIWVKIEAVEAKMSKFSQKVVLLTDSFAWNGTLGSGRRGVKRGSSGPYIPIPPF